MLYNLFVLILFSKIFDLYLCVITYIPISGRGRNAAFLLAEIFYIINIID